MKCWPMPRTGWAKTQRGGAARCTRSFSARRCRAPAPFFMVCGAGALCLALAGAAQEAIQP